jgi:hypothetical protein
MAADHSADLLAAYFGADSENVWVQLKTWHEVDQGLEDWEAIVAFYEVEGLDTYADNFNAYWMHGPGGAITYFVAINLAGDSLLAADGVELAWR